MVFDGSNMKINSGREGFRSAKTGPGEKPKSDFRKVMEKEGDDRGDQDHKKQVSKEEKEVKGTENYEEIANQEDGVQSAPKNKGLSLFDLAGIKEEALQAESLKDAEGEISMSELSDELKEESLSALFKGYGSKERLKAIQEEVDSNALAKKKVPDGGEVGKGGEIAIQPKEMGSDTRIVETHLIKRRQPMEDLAAESTDTGPNPYMEDKGKNLSKFAEVQSDLSGINPLFTTPSTPPQTASIQGEQRAMATHLQEIIDQIIDKLYTVNTSGKTDTLIKLKHPPLFAGSNIVITSFDTAKGEFNITFENLSQAAKNLLDMRENQEALKFALDQKGYTVHIITATTLTETIGFVEGKGPGGEREEEGKSKSDSQGKDEQEEEKKEQ